MKTYTVTEIDSRLYDRIEDASDLVLIEAKGNVMGSGYTEQEVEEILKGYTFDGYFFRSAGEKWMYIVEED